MCKLWIAIKWLSLQAFLVVFLLTFMLTRTNWNTAPRKRVMFVSHNIAGSPQTPPLACPWKTSLRLKKVDNARTELRLVCVIIVAMATQQYVSFYCCWHGCRAQQHENATVALFPSCRMFPSAPNNNSCYVLCGRVYYCLCVPAFESHLFSTVLWHLWPVWQYHIFPHNIKCVLLCSLQLFPGTFLSYI